MRWVCYPAGLLMLCVIGLSGTLWADAAGGGEDPVRAVRPNDANGGWTLLMKTLGGRQFWGDVQFFHGWHIQKNVLTGRFRLLDENDNRHASGTLKGCRAKLEQIRKERKLPPMKGKGVIVIHGIIRSSKSFGRMTAKLKQCGYEVFPFDYPSTRIQIPEAAEYLHRVINSLEGTEQIDLVVHSMGGLVVRSYLAKHHDRRIRRMVMIGVPNRGARMADRMKQNVIFKTVFGPAGQQLVSNPNGLVGKLPTPDFPFAIISGARGSMNGYNPLIPGDDDGTVGVASTRLPGAADFMTVNALHSFLVYRDDVIGATAHFLQTGRLRKKGRPHPIPRKPAANADNKTTTKSTTGQRSASSARETTP